MNSRSHTFLENKIPAPMCFLTQFPSAPILSITADENLLTHINQGYKEDPWCTKLIEASPRPHGITMLDNLLYVGN
jgi:hypothetical protein